MSSNTQDGAAEPTTSLASGDTPVEVNLEAIAGLGARLQRLIEETSELFPEREHFINQAVYALLTREHVLVHGKKGTGKTDIVKTLFGAFSGQFTFSIHLNKFMTESHVIGVPDPKEMREEGVLRYRREGGILEAQFAELDEFLDANGPLLRVLLGILNEREFKRGMQFEKARLHTAIASTNGDPEAAVKQSPDLDAVIDRFLFQCGVSYLGSASSRRKMYERATRRKGLEVAIAYADLSAVSNLIGRVTRFDDPLFLDSWEELIEGYKKAFPQQPVSDRRAVKLLKLAEASALLHGRLEVAVEDIEAARWGLCTGNSKPQHEAFDKILKPIIDKANTTRQQTMDLAQAKLLSDYRTNIPSIPPQVTNDQAVELYKRLHALRKQVEDVKPQLPSTKKTQQDILSKISQLMNELHGRMVS